MQVQETHQQNIMIDHWPQDACSYCGLDNKNCIVKCTNRACGKWFCNQNISDTEKKSHIIHHLIVCKHHQISTHQHSLLNGIFIECFLCGNKNIFTLGFVKATNIDTTNIFICRQQCKYDKKQQTQLEWNPKEWCPLVDKNELLNLIGKKATEIDLKIKLSIKDIKKLQTAWKQHPEYRYYDIADKPVRILKKSSLAFESAKQYKSIFIQILTEQIKAQKELKQSQTKQNVQIQFHSNNGQKFAVFKLSCEEQTYDNLFVLGAQLRITSEKQWNAVGIIVKISEDSQISLKLINSDPYPAKKMLYKVQFVINSNYLRLKRALLRFVKDKKTISSYLHYSILGFQEETPDLQIEVPQKLQVPGLPKLNSSQQQAIKIALNLPLCLIQGPPGTGKTVTSASIAYYLVKLTKKQILVCAPSNIVADMLAQKIHQTGVNVVRLCSRSRESISTQVDFLTLHYKIASLQDNIQLRKYQKIIDSGDFTPEEQRIYKQMKRDIEQKILQQADVICSTCVTAADPRLKKYSFNHVLIDQATQATQPTCLLPLLKQAKHVILVGDHKQLGPVVISRLAAKAGLDRSLFQRLLLLGHKPIRLSVQYRMHPSISLFPSDTFYEGSLQNGISEQDRKLNVYFPWFNNKPNMFLNVIGYEQRSASGTSYINRDQTLFIDKILLLFYKSGIKSNQIGIITPYKGQKGFLTTYFKRNGKLNDKDNEFYKQIQIASVDGFQGRQKDYMIVSCVRSNQQCSIGFLKQPRRLNVSITRAKFGMIIIGNSKVLSSDKLWRDLINSYKKSKNYLEGSVMNFRECNVPLQPKPITFAISTRAQLQNNTINNQIAEYSPKQNKIQGQKVMKKDTIKIKNAKYKQKQVQQQEQKQSP